MLERQREGIAAAKAAGKYKGRPANIDAAEIKRLAATMRPAVSRAVNSVRNNGADMLDRIDDPHAPPPSDAPAGDNPA